MYMILLSKSKDYILDPKTGQTTDEDTEYHYKYTAVSSNSVHSTHTTLIALLKSMGDVVTSCCPKMLVCSDLSRTAGLLMAYVFVSGYNEFHSIAFDLFPFSQG